MRVALKEARKGLGRTSPNPAVGAVLVSGNKIISKGHHALAGGPHAEIQCLKSLRGRAPANSTLYVTLEPCSTFGKTGPCTRAIIGAKVPNVVIGALDPNPQHKGRGISRLERAGIKVRAGVLASECADLNEGFNKWIVTRMPFVIAKCGMSLDGRLTRPPHETPWITSVAARRDAQKLRSQVDAILVGGETIRRDNPRLTVRGVKNARQPWRVVLTRNSKLPAHSHILRDRFKQRTMVYRNQSLKRVLADLGKKEVLSVMLEGGGSVLGQALDAGLIDKIQIYVGPIFTGGPIIAFGGRGAEDTKSATRFKRLSYKRIGRDIRVIGHAAGLGRRITE